MPLKVKPRKDRQLNDAKSRPSENEGEDASLIITSSRAQSRQTEAGKTWSDDAKTMQ